MYKQTLCVTLPMSAAVIIAAALFANADGIDPPEGPIGKTMHTLEEIYAAVTQPQCCAPSPAPSQIVSATRHIPDSGLWQVPIPLEEGEVFILTAWTLFTVVNEFARLRLYEGNTGDVTTIRDSLAGISSSTSGQAQVGQHVFPTGIRFPRAANGMADIYAQKVAPAVSLRIVVHGYITDDL